MEELLEVSKKNRKIFDPIYGLITLTPIEWEIIHSPFYQRLRWIKQLGFSCYVFPGAEHSRFGHSIGVMHNCHRILQSCQLAVSEECLTKAYENGKAAIFNQELRLAALMHDLGTFPFSHTIEGAYIRYAKMQKIKGAQNHEDLGQHIIKNTYFPNGISEILTKYKMDPNKIASLVTGNSKSVFANQVLHSEIDCDRMDYLLRDAHYTGLRYGSYDRDYLLNHFVKVDVPQGPILAIKENALHCVEDFLMARFTWYGQVIRSQRGAKFDFLAEEIYTHFLSRNYCYSFDELMDMVIKNPNKFYQFNDSYFIEKLFEYQAATNKKKDPKIVELCKILTSNQSSENIKYMDFNHCLLDQDDIMGNQKAIHKVNEKLEKIEAKIKKRGNPADWILKDIPTKNIVFVKSLKSMVRDKSTQNLLLERDPVKILCDDGSVKLLAQMENSIIGRLQNVYSFTPNAYCSSSVKELMKEF